ncbi:hypothetical protein ACH5RR_031691 [Cinchona calisaya]|uniref:GDT1 family protein n=1 Tax=Cinchona calisaya TaxID=153742 RepID=A0ABD2YFY7_9GENT
MQGTAVQIPQVIAASNKGIFKKNKKLPFSPLSGQFPCFPRGLISPDLPSSESASLPSLTQCRWISRSLIRRKPITTHASSVGVGSGSFEGSQENGQNVYSSGHPSDNSSKIDKPPNRIPYPLSIALVLCGCALVFLLIVFMKGSPSALLGALAKSGFTAAFSLIFVSEIGDKALVARAVRLRSGILA